MRRNHILRTSVALATVTALLGACSEGSADTDDKADESSSTSSSSPTEGTSTPPDEIGLPDGVFALPEPESGEDVDNLDAGRYRVPLSDTLSFDVDLPQGTSSHSNGYFLGFRDFLLNVTVADETYGVPTHPCRDQSDLEIGSTVDDLVEAIISRPVYRVSRPEPAELGGASGQFFEIRIPARYDASPCHDSVVGLPRPAADGTSTVASGYVGRWWILDVDGQRVVIQQFCGPCAADTADRIARTANSITFTPTS
jgi:hypothetical protein